jgi:D-arabinose 1-dehydrogenase-like Zn-dependent alcohol dehydrogenase
MAANPTATEQSPQTGTAARTMRVAQMTAFRKPIEVVELPVSPPRRDGAVVRVEASGVCRSDWHFWNQDLAWLGFKLSLPANTGHEVGGVVEEVGPDVRTIKVGDRVTIPFHESDGVCPHCRAGRQNLCDNVIIPGVQRIGGWAQYVTVTAADLNCIKLPDQVDTLTAAALGCRFMTGYRAVIGRGQAQPGEWTAVHGCGGVGLSAVQVAAQAGALVVAVDIDDRKLAKAREEGAVATVNAGGLTPQQVGQAVKDATGGGASLSIDALGRGFTFHQSFHSLCKGGRHVQAGITSREEAGEVSLPLDLLTNMELEVVGSLGNPHPKYAELLALVAQGKLQPARLVTRQIALDEVTDTLERMTRFDTVGFEVITRFD